MLEIMEKEDAVNKIQTKTDHLSKLKSTKTWSFGINEYSNRIHNQEFKWLKGT